MSDTAKCPDCGAPLAANAPGGLCPNCLMALNLKTETMFSDDPPTAQSPLPPEQITPHFPQLEILEFLGRGGMGVVYKARQKTLNRFVALKLMVPERVGDPKFAERFAREAQALAALNHPNIVTIHDFGQAGGFYYLLMEFVDGANLRHLLQAQKFTPEEALAIVPPLCEALQYAHERGIVHRDIKPENLLLDKTGRVKIADFGIAKMLGTVDATRVGASATTEDTTTQSALGTRGYSAPEQQNPPSRVDSRADIYSLGVVLYEMLTGELPGKIIEAPSKKVHIDVRLDAVVLRALEKTPELRWQTAAEMRTQVETIAQTTTTAGGDSDRPTPETLDARILEREIRAHMTPVEREAYEKRRNRYAWTCALPVAVFATLMAFTLPASLVVLIRDLFFLSFLPIPFLMWRQSRFLCSTEWAKTQNIKPRRFWQLTSTPPGVGLAMAVAALAISLFFLGLVFQVKSRGPTLHDSVPFSPVIAVLPVAIVFICVMALMWLRRNPLDPAPLASTHAWLALMDKGDYGGSWEAAAKRFKRAITKNEWMDRAQITCQPLGRVISRKVRMTWRFGPRFTVKFDTVFAGLKSAVETLTFKRERDGQWRAIGYLILPAYADVSWVRKMAWGAMFCSGTAAIACVVFPFLQPISPHHLLLGIPVAALLGMDFGAKAKERPTGRIAMWVGLATLLAWLAIAAFAFYRTVVPPGE